MDQTPIERWIAGHDPATKQQFKEIIKSGAFHDLLYAVWSQYTLNQPAQPNPQLSWDAHSRKLGAQDFMRQLVACLDEKAKPSVAPFLSENLEPETPTKKPTK